MKLYTEISAEVLSRQVIEADTGTVGRGDGVTIGGNSIGVVICEPAGPTPVRIAPEVLDSEIGVEVDESRAVLVCGVFSLLGASFFLFSIEKGANVGYNE